MMKEFKKKWYDIVIYELDGCRDGWLVKVPLSICYFVAFLGYAMAEVVVAIRRKFV